MTERKAFSLPVQAEEALLGAVLLDPAGRHHVLDLVVPEDMQRPWHAQVLAAMRRVQATGAQPGPVEVYRELQSDPDLPESVSRDAVPLAALMEASPRAEHAGAYAAMVVEGGIRHRLGLGGSRLAQAAESGGLEAALWQAGWARGEVDGFRARWLGILAHTYGELAPSLRDRRVHADAGHHTAAVRKEVARLRAELRMGQSAELGERVASIARHLAEAAGAPDRDAAWRPSTLARPQGNSAEAAGARALRDLAASPSQLARVSTWLRPEHFARADDGDLFAVMRDMQAAGSPVDAVTVTWQAARQGIHVEPSSLMDGTAPFAVASAREVHRHGMLAQAVQTGKDIQADAADMRCRPHRLLESAGERLRALEAAPHPDRDPARDVPVVTMPRQASPVGLPRETGREALP